MKENKHEKIKSKEQPRNKNIKSKKIKNTKNINFQPKYDVQLEEE